MTFQYFLQLVISGLVIGSIYSAVALGFVIIYKATRVVNFAQGELLMVGAYVCYAFLVQMHVPFWAALFLTILFGMVLAMFVERLILRPMIGEPAISIIMVTIGLSLVLRSLASAIWGTDILVYEPKLFPQEMISFAGVPVSLEFVWCFVLSVFLLAVFSIFFKYSKAGVAMRATAFNQQVAQSMGISGYPRSFPGSAEFSSGTSTESTTPSTTSVSRCSRRRSWEGSTRSSVPRSGE